MPFNRAKDTSKVLGFLFIIATVFIAFYQKCLTNGSSFILYEFCGLGIGLIWNASTKNASLKLNLSALKIGLVGGVAIPFALFYTNPIGKFQFDNCNLFRTITVFVHGKKGKQDLILRQQGYVLMDVDGERKRESIDEKGEAKFSNIRTGDVVKLNIDFSEPYTSVYPDSNYIISNDGEIYLLIELEGINKVKGMVLYKDQPLPEVTVKIDSLLAKTDTLGCFKIEIPAYLQSKKYNVYFNKAGFQSASYIAYPQTNQDLRIVMSKIN
jgi:hypothetical protein